MSNQRHAVAYHRFAPKQRVRRSKLIAINGVDNAHMMDDKVVYEERRERSINRVRSELPRFAELGTNYEARLLRGAVAKPKN